MLGYVPINNTTILFTLIWKALMHFFADFYQHWFFARLVCPVSFLVVIFVIFSCKAFETFDSNICLPMIEAT
jgi:hypothetical protein